MKLSSISSRIDDPKALIERELRKVDNTKTVGNSVLVCCPFHNDSDPSCSVNLDTTSKVPFGYFFCFGCQEKGHWNKLADKLGLSKIPEWAANSINKSGEHSERDIKNLLSSLERLKPISENDKTDQLMRSFRVKSYAPWSVYEDWRGFSGDFLNSLGAFSAVTYTDYVNLVLPVMVFNQIRGAVMAYSQKPKKGSAYLNSPGHWAKSFGLFPYDYVNKICSEKSCPSVYLVEGPRDALRFIRHGIPALCVLGASSFGEEKVKLLTQLRTKNLCVLPDNDNGGEVFEESVSRVFKSFYSQSALPFTVTFLHLPKTSDKIDPFSLSPELFRSVCSKGGYHF